MASTYTANLAAFLTVSIAPSQINSLDDLASQSEIKPSVILSSNLWTAFKVSKDPLFTNIWSKMEGGPMYTNTVDQMKLVNTGRYAFIDDRLALEYTYLLDCNKYALAPESFNTAGYGFILPADAPYKNAFNYNIIKMQESGLISKWKKKWWPSTDKCTSSTKTHGATVLDLSSVGGLFLIYGAVTLFSVACLLVEKCYFSSCRIELKKIKQFRLKKTAVVPLTPED